MCLGVPGVVIDVKDEGLALVEVNGIIVEADTAYLQVSPGDTVIVHAGLIIAKVSEDEAITRRRILSELEELVLKEIGDERQL